MPQGDPRMKRTWAIIGVGDVAGSFRWYQSLFGQPETAPAHADFGMILSDGTVLLCLHEWTGTMEFSLRDSEGYYVTISALSAA
jgi:hypothetical protein